MREADTIRISMARPLPKLFTPTFRDTNPFFSEALAGEVSNGLSLAAIEQCYVYRRQTVPQDRWSRPN